MDNTVVDLPEVMERVQNSTELLSELFDIFEEDFIEKRKLLTAALTSKDVQQIKDIAHSLKGASGNISAKIIYSLCLEMEQKAKQASLDGLDGILSQLDKQFVALQGYIKEFKVQNPS